MKLIIVESPSKAKTIEKYLGKNYKVEASGGHVRDLPQRSYGVDIKNNFEPKYVQSPGKRKVISTLKDAKKKADEVYLATDPDREGEAISWHLANILKMNVDEDNRIEFNEITKTAVEKAINNPRKVDINLVDAQQARRVMDRIVGYELSPAISKRIQPKLSAGRVQSVALRLVVEREREIKNFVPVEYWTLTAYLCSENEKNIIFKAKLATKKGKKYVPATKAEVDEVIEICKNKGFEVTKYKESLTKSHAPAPFTTSTLQQTASNQLSMAATKTMRIAQQLYEGVYIRGEGQLALVTYIRTDSVRISNDAYNMAMEHIKDNFGEKYLPKKRNFYKNKNSSQDAHEAIRPVNLMRTPEELEDKLERDQYRVYKLIYERFLASQMVEATYDSVSCTASAGEFGFNASGRKLHFEGFLAAYKNKKNNSEEEDQIPKMKLNEKLISKKVEPEQKFTQPPARFTDASLIKLLEENGIGRPSTYASILNVLRKREYTEKEGRAIVPTEIAFKVVDFLVDNFPNIMSPKFTADFEKQLDGIEEEGTDWRAVVGKFYEPFGEKLNELKESEIKQTDTPCPKCGTMLFEKLGRYGRYLDCPNEDCDYKKSLDDEVTDQKCEKCGAPMIKKRGRYGEYLACSNYPECKNTISLKKGTPQKPDEPTDEICENCGAPMVLKHGRFGDFLACTNYPKCKTTRPAGKPVCKCPECGKDVYEKRSKRGKIFYGCSGYPKCKFASWDKPLEKKCPKCGAYLVEHENKKENTTTIKCSNKECDYVEN